jgi:hypothetical protein
MSYQDLILAFVPAADSERFHIVTHSPAEGQIVASFVSPFGEERINTWRYGLDPHEIRMIGTLLYRRVFSPEVHRALDASRRFAQRQGLAVRLKLILSADVAHLPWEFLYEPEADEFLALNQRVPIVRYFDLPMTPPGHRHADSLGLALFAPDGIESDAHPLFAAWAEKPAAQIHILTSAEINSAAKSFSKAQVLHLQAASGRDPASGQLALRMDDSAETRWLTEDSLAQWLRVNASIQLVVLDGCDSSDGTTRDAVAFAARLVERGIVPSAVAFQFPLKAKLRAEFFETFYRAWANDAGLGLAMVEGRQAIAKADGAWEWGAPVLYSALRDDQPRPEPEPFPSSVRLSDAHLDQRR